MRIIKVEIDSASGSMVADHRPVKDVRYEESFTKPPCLYLDDELVTEPAAVWVDGVLRVVIGKPI